MGKPIAGQNQFPYRVGGFLVDGANINGVTYAKKLYIYKQRSYDTYDLQDTEGNIFRFIKIGYHDTNGKMLDYFDVVENLVETIPVNTFFMKIQDPARGIFSFVRIYQWHKCITVEGDYVYRTKDTDPRLSGVLINPSISTIQSGKTLSYETLFYPHDYHDKDGTWYVNALDGKRTSDISIVSTDKNTALVKAEKEGRAVLSFVPKKNDALITHSIVHITEEVLPLEVFEPFPAVKFDTARFGEEFTYELVTYPYDAVLTEPAEVSCREYIYGDGFDCMTYLVSVSEDFKKYTFVCDLTYGTPDDYSLNVPTITFTIKEPIEYQYSSTAIGISDGLFYDQRYNIARYNYVVPERLRPNMTYQAVREIKNDYQGEFPIVSSDPSIATMDINGLVTTYGKTGSVYFSTQYRSSHGQTLDFKYKTLFVTEDAYDRVIRTPVKQMDFNPGEIVQFKLTGIREGYDPVELPFQKMRDPQVYDITEDGLVTVYPNARINGIVNIHILESFDYGKIISPYKSMSSLYWVNEPNVTIPVKSLQSNWDRDNGFAFTELGRVGHAYISALPENCNDFELEIVSYDETIIEIREKDYLLNNYQYIWDSGLAIMFIGLKKGSTELVVRAVNYPDITYTVKVVIY